MNIEIRNKIVTGGYKERTIKYLVIDGIVDEDSYVSDDDAPHRHASVYNEDAIEALKKYSMKDIHSIFETLHLHLDIEIWEEWINVTLNDEDFRREKAYIRFDLQISDWEHWAKPWSIASVAEQIKFNVQAYTGLEIEYWQDEDDSVLNGFGIDYYPSDLSLTLAQTFEIILPTITDILDKTNKSLLTTIDHDAVLTYFQFPEEIKTACKQYLVYFAQFITDIGIEVDTEIKDELNNVLFKITPKDKAESLERIQKVLSIYLDAPNNTNFQYELARENDIAVKQWEANVYHLKSQLALATSIIQAKDATIESLQLTNYQYRQLIEDHSKKETDKEEVVKGVLSVEKYEGNGFSINLAEILRRLKRIVKR